MIETKYGKLEGVQKEGCCVYYGIPFAKPPVGELLFKHPLPPEPWEGVLKADKGSANAPQVADEFSMKYISPDCLYLNVFVPDGLKEPAPVMVWIHGGAYYEGGAGALEPDSTEVMYDMTLFARETGCILVTLNYRLNVYGFLNLHAFNPDFDQNNGLYDQIMALKFVKETIASFGGDPENITLFGQSAGGSCVLALMTMKEADGLFAKTIVQSPCVDHFFKKSESIRYTRKFLRLAGVKRPEELLTLPEEELMDAVRLFNRALLLAGDIRCAYSPVIDEGTLPVAPREAVKNCPLPMMIGNVTEEGNLFIDPVPTAALPLFSLYFHVPSVKTNGNYKKRVSDSLTDHVFVKPIKDIAASYFGPVWRYVFDYCAPDNKLGKCHISELPVLFGSNNIMGNVDDEKSQEVGKRARKIWGDFARYGNPGWPEDTAVWIR